MFRAILRLIYLTNMFFVNGLEAVIFQNAEICDFTFVIGEFKKNKDTVAFQDTLIRGENG